MLVGLSLDVFFVPRGNLLVIHKQHNSLHIFRTLGFLVHNLSPKES